MEDLIKLLDVVIWPVTILIILYWFRTQLRTVFGRLTNLNASTTGITMSFGEKLEAAKNMAKNLQSKSVSKSGPHINPSNSSSNLKEFNKIQSLLLDDLKRIASNQNIVPEGKSIRDLSNMLKEKGLLKFEKVKLIEAFDDLGKLAGSKISDGELKDIKEIYSVIKS